MATIFDIARGGPQHRVNTEAQVREGNVYQKRLLASTALILAMSLETAKADSITASLFSPEPPSGTAPDIIGLSGISPPSDSEIVGSGYTITFSVASNEGVVQGTTTYVNALPVAGVSSSGAPEYLTGGFGSSLTTNAADSGNYLSTGVGTITITFSKPQESLALLWGSIDTGNSLTLNDSSNFDVTGTEVQAAAKGFVGNGYEGPGGSAWVVINTTTPFTTATFNSSYASFEFDAVAAATSPFTSPVPEPSILFLMGTGAITLLTKRRIARLRQQNMSMNVDTASIG